MAKSFRKKSRRNKRKSYSKRRRTNKCRFFNFKICGGMTKDERETFLNGMIKEYATQNKIDNWVTEYAEKNPIKLQELITTNYSILENDIKKVSSIDNIEKKETVTSVNNKSKRKVINKKAQNENAQNEKIKLFSIVKDKDISYIVIKFENFETYELVPVETLFKIILKMEMEIENQQKTDTRTPDEYAEGFVKNTSDPIIGDTIPKNNTPSYDTRPRNTLGIGERPNIDYN